MTIGYTNAQLVCSRFNLRFLRHQMWAKRSMKRKSVEDRMRKAAMPAAKPKRRRGGGGLWRTWVSKNARGRRRGVSGVSSAEYKAWKARGGEEVEALKKEASAATKAHKSGGKAFGVRRRFVDRFKAKRLRHALLDQGVSPSTIALFGAEPRRSCARELASSGGAQEDGPPSFCA